RLARKSLLPHQKTALEKFHEHFKTQDRGQLIMACGTGKTFTSLKIAENETNGQGLVLFLAPSIALISQLLLEWSSNSEKPLYSICVCSDPSVSRIKKKKNEDDIIFSVEDLALPATTKVPQIIKQLEFARERHPNQLCVIFSTYQSIDKVSEALKKVKLTVDLIVCDEAHRTTGVILMDEDEGYFTKVHDNTFIKAKKRLYMTATPRIYAESLKRKAEDFSATLCSMDDENLFGPEVYRLGFGESVDRDLLSDYKVLVLTVNRNEISEKTQDELTEGQKEIEADDITKLIGCLNALSKNMTMEGKVLRQVDPDPMLKAVAFCQTIAKSKKITKVFKALKDNYCQNLPNKENYNLVDVEADHIDGAMGACLRNEKLSWLRSDSEKCRILCNVHVLSEGVDVPSLDAVLFLSAKNSQIEVVQSVGRVMRKAEGKKFGYIIIPVVVPSSVDPEDALNDNERFKVVWTVLNALKAHDDRFNALINKIQFNKIAPTGGGSVLIGGISGGDTHDLRGPGTRDLLSGLQPSDDGLYRHIYARLVKKVGFKQDMLLWAADVAKIAEGFKARITKVVNQKGPHKEEFDRFLSGLRKTLNPSVDETEAIEMLAQHLITKPVFEALFENYSFVQNNPVSKSLETMIEVLEDQGLEKDKVILSRFYKTVKEEVAGIDTPEARQKIIVKLYDNFFKIAMPNAVEKLGIVYTPVEIVDFINYSVAKALKKEFNLEITDDNINILDPFSGTGTFITRLIQSGLLGQGEILTRQYQNCLHANEIILLAYYIASINIENAYYEVIDEDINYKPFKGICLTDTFQLYEKEEGDDLYKNQRQRFRINTKRVNDQNNTHIRVIIGNPPYSKGQDDVNKNSKNQSYPNLDYRIKTTYSEQSIVTNKNPLYDSYIKSFRWSSDRLDENGGIIGFVTNAGWLDGAAMDGMRKCLVNEFSSIYVFNLRGNCRTQGEQRRKEKDNVFGLGSRTPVAITILVKNPAKKGLAKIYYHDIGDYLSREQKLAIIAQRHDIFGPEMVWENIVPNDKGDWLNQRSDLFSKFIQIGDKDNKFNKKTFFVPYYSLGINTARQAWCFNFSSSKLINNIKLTINYYNNERKLFHNNFLLN
ncbi:MAG: DEAD/DEAH box helicase family protein, partial [Deltaproteobacteria bacterium]|nr:DEAD/DEAH box helicase family protein [Deltaproteobacteria bacterium]